MESVSLVDVGRVPRTGRICLLAGLAALITPGLASGLDSGGGAEGTPNSLAKELTVELSGSARLEMILIPAGEFQMGSPNSDLDAHSGERPQHRVRITRPFYLGKYLVTQQQWAAVMGTNPSRFKWPRNPVEQISWDDCREFLRKLNSRSDGHPGRFDLPSEAQWEYACRAGTKTKFCFGDDLSRLGQYAWYDANSGGKTHPVGEKKPNVWGLYDMHGNVWEWCHDCYDDGYFAKSPIDDPAGITASSFRIIRGGGWYYSAKECRSANRFLSGPEYRYHVLGMRAALILPK
jgi:formylglycine-generating enzyme required for sulfatase activity